MFNPPKHSLGADLVWWRTAAGGRTVISLLKGRVQQFPDPLHLHAILFDDQGSPLVDWRMDLPEDLPLLLDSDAEGPWRRLAGRDGLLALYACTQDEPSIDARKNYNRLFPLVDWQRGDGRTATLHSDQTIRRMADPVQRFTEIVVLETEAETNALVVLNGEVGQDADVLDLLFRNHRGETRRATYSNAMAPFTVHRIGLSSFVPDIASFSAGQPLLISGRFASKGLFTRPYVETTGQRWGAYHAGNVYHWPDVPYPAHSLIGGEVNPAAVWHDERTRTYVNVLHSHDGDAGDTVVEARLFDLDGNCIAHRPEWLVACRGGLARMDVSTLLADPWQPFRGLLSLRFSPPPGQAVPCHLQALMEYRRAGSIARVMTWSDEWNSRVRLAMRRRGGTPPRFRSYFRIRQERDGYTVLAISNPGHSGYDGSAEVDASYHCQSGAKFCTRFSLPPYGTRFASIRELFADQASLPEPTAGVLVLESTSDLANLGFHVSAGEDGLAAEHFMSLYSRHEGGILRAAGS